MIGLPGLATLSLYATVLSLAVPKLLCHARWVVRAPRLAIALWQALSAAWLISLALIGLTLGQPLLERLASPQFQDGGITLLGATAAAAGIAFAISIVARGGYMIARELAWARRERHTHSLALTLAGNPADTLDATIIEHPTPAVYCLPAPHRQQTVVVSTGAVRLLSEQELAAVVAHERGHLRLHHHHVTAIAGALHLAFPRVPLLHHANQEIQTLAEMAADDHARRNHSTEALATALLAVATGRTPERTLGAAGHTVTSRLERMLAPARPLPAPKRLATAATAAGAITLPIGLACTTVFTAAILIIGRLLS